MLILCLSGRDLWAAEWLWADSLAAGAPLPEFSVVDISNAVIPVQSLYGKKGLLLFFSRSTQWWPYCIRQLVELSEHAPDLKSKGVNVAAVLYDSRAELERFSHKYEITFPLLSDPESSAIIQLGLLNPNYDPSSKYYGVPFPGVFLVNSKGIIVGKFAEENYRDRPLMEDLIGAVNQLDWSFAHYLRWSGVEPLVICTATALLILMTVVASMLSLDAMVGLIDGSFALMAIPTMTSTIILAPKVMLAERIYFAKI
jgi:peroxiredoxin